MNCKRSGHRLRVTIPWFYWRDWGKLCKPSVRLGDVPGHIRTEHLPRTNLECLLSSDEEVAVGIFLAWTQNGDEGSASWPAAYTHRKKPLSARWIGTAKDPELTCTLWGREKSLTLLENRTLTPLLSSTLVTVLTELTELYSVRALEWIPYTYMTSWVGIA
jgi:hypothetical protein